jgi:hypothetical protein
MPSACRRGAAGRPDAYAEYTALLRDPTAEAVRALLRERYPEETLDFDVDRALDLNVAFFG